MTNFAQLLASESAFKQLIQKGIWSTYSANLQKLHPIHNYYHAPSGLHNEGVWHNYIMGLSYYLCLPLYRYSDPNFCQELEQALKKVSTNVRKLNFDEKMQLFKSRSKSGYWDHSSKQQQQENIVDGVTKEKIFLITENDEKKCVANCIAGLFYSCYNSTEEPILDPLVLFQTIQKEFFNDEYQLLCSKLEKRTHFRAVDHALFCLLAVKLKQDSVVKSLVDTIWHRFEFKNLVNKETSLQTCNYIDEQSKNNGQFLWQDSWILMSLTIATKYLSSAPITPTELHKMILNTYQKYFCQSNSIPQLKGCNGMASEPMERKAVYLSQHCFTGDQAVFLAMIHVFDFCFPGLLGEFKDKHTTDAIQLFDTILFKQETCQFCISEKYHSTALWTSTETILSFLLVKHSNPLVNKLFF